MNLLNRLIDITSSRLKNKLEGIFTSEWQKKSDKNQERDSKFESSYHQQYRDYRQDYQSTNESNADKRFVLDLEIFDLSPPSNWQEVRQRRNALMKQYHSDLYSRDNAKEKIAKEITQIHNEAYDRLKKHFGQN